MANVHAEDEHAGIRVDPPPIGERVRGRNRSESFAADDDLMLSEIDAAVGNSSQSQGSAPAAPAASPGPKKQADGQLSRRTLKILNSLEPEGPPGAKRRSGPVDDALLAEALLAEEEAAAAASASSGVIRRASVPTSAKTAPEHDMVIKILLLGDGGTCCHQLACRSHPRRLSAAERAGGAAAAGSSSCWTSALTQHALHNLVSQVLGKLVCCFATPTTPSVQT